MTTRTLNTSPPTTTAITTTTTTTTKGLYTINVWVKFDLKEVSNLVNEQPDRRTVDQSVRPLTSFWEFSKSGLVR